MLNIIILIPLSLCLVSTTSLNSCESYIHVSLLQDHATNLVSFEALGFRRVLAILAPLSVYFLLLSYVPLPDGAISSGMSDAFTLVTARYNVLGIFILGSLSGFGSVTTAWGYFPLPCGKNRHVNHAFTIRSVSLTVRGSGGFQRERNLTAQSRVLLASVPILKAKEKTWLPKKCEPPLNLMSVDQKTNIVRP